MLKKQHRITKDKEFEAVFKKGQIFFSPFFNIKIAKNNRDIARFGIIINNRISKKAVIRNKSKRQLRSIIKLNLPNIIPGVDVVIMAKPAITVTEFAKLQQTFEFLLKQAGLIKK